TCESPGAGRSCRGGRDQTCKALQLCRSRRPTGCWPSPRKRPPPPAGPGTRGRRKPGTIPTPRPGHPPPRPQGPGRAPPGPGAPGGVAVPARPGTQGRSAYLRDWLEGLPVRTCLRDPVPFDRLALAWLHVQPLLVRIDDLTDSELAAMAASQLCWDSNPLDL